MSLTALVAMVALDIFLVEVISVFSLGNDLVAHKCRVLNAMFEKRDNANNQIEQKWFYRNMILQIQDNDEWVWS